MTDTELIEETITFVKETLRGAEGGHDWFHIQRVFRNSLHIARDEEVNVLVVSLAALLHDIADAKFHDGDETLGPKIASEFLSALGVQKEVRQHVLKIIENISFKNSLDKSKREKFHSRELEVVQDADRLDAIGAIGIARAFNYGGYKNRELYNPDIAPRPDLNKEAYKKSKSPTINHFYEKLLLLKDQMNTSTGKKLAEQRHQFLLDYLQQFYAEWNGER
ncbi:HD domain-containing protein [Muricauda sp. SCSIO 64092]|uniref:HD domain-containing protein n=1 Tax=Allomuricauda sp. SCSIO 64092 TaxID=2908842 RepID=UPI001FF512B5|nr:HD domain-containing protein [Muricauda sp. SCSIO 64092]UOY08656.1 HD domain-containing protein [Muricauda sp. SCSIO 64092]